MGLLKQLTRSLFGSFLSSKKKKSKRKKGRKKAKAKKKVVRKKARKKKIVKKKKSVPKKSSRKTSVKKKAVKKKARKNPKKVKKKAVKKTKSKKQPKPKSKKAQKEGELIGEVTHYFPNVNVGVIEIKQDQLIRGEEVVFKGATTSFKQKIKSMQIDRVDIDMALPGNEIGIKVKKRVRAGDLVYKPIKN